MPEFAERRDEREAAKAQRAERSRPRSAPRWRGASRRARPTPPTRSRPSPPARRRRASARRHATSNAPRAATARRRALGQRLREPASRPSRPSCGAPTTARLERTVGSDTGLRVLFGGMAQRFRPDKAAGLHGRHPVRPARRRRGRAVDGHASTAAARERPARAGPTMPSADASRSGVADFLRIAGARARPGQGAARPAAWCSRATSPSPRGWGRCSGRHRRCSTHCGPCAGPRTMRTYVR